MTSIGEVINITVIKLNTLTLDEGSIKSEPLITHFHFSLFPCLLLLFSPAAPPCLVLLYKTSVKSFMLLCCLVWRQYTNAFVTSLSLASSFLRGWDLLLSLVPFGCQPAVSHSHLCPLSLEGKRPEADH